MTQKFTAEEVRAVAASFARVFNEGVSSMLTAYAERIEADERAVPVGYFNPSFGSLGFKLTQIAGYVPVYLHPPAQAAQLNNAVEFIRGLMDTAGALLDAETHRRVAAFIRDLECVPPTAKPAQTAQVDAYCERNDCPCRMAVADCRHKKTRDTTRPHSTDAAETTNPPESSSKLVGAADIEQARADTLSKPPRFGGCCCGEPCTLGVVHRTDGPCFMYEQPADSGRVGDEGAAFEAMDSLRAAILRLDGLTRRDCLTAFTALESALAAQPQPAASSEPIPMILHCPSCGLQHIDAPDHPHAISVHMDGHESRWDNPPHRSHMCQGCGTIWRPADVPTVGVAAINTKGNADVVYPASPAGVPDGMTWDAAKLLARKAIYADGRGMIGAERRFLEDRVARAILAAVPQPEES